MEEEDPMRVHNLVEDPMGVVAHSQDLELVEDPMGVVACFQGLAFVEEAMKVPWEDWLLDLSNVYHIVYAHPY